jgi:hypothetical protein
MEKEKNICRLDAFHCPHCGAYVKQEWHDVAKGQRLEGEVGYYEAFIAGLSLSLCSRCGQYALWRDEEMIFPVSSASPSPVESMPRDVKAYFLEAKDTFSASPRAAAALLRLALQQLMVHLGEHGKNLDRDITHLAKRGLPPIVQEALVSVRFIGNDAVRPGEISLKDNTCVAATLFDLVNMIVEIMLSHSRALDGQGRLIKSVQTGRKRKEAQKQKKWNTIFYR